jgi:hypothetical protein
MEENSSLEVPLYTRSNDDGDKQDIIGEEIPSFDVTNYFSSKGTIQGYKDAIFLLLFGMSVLIVCAIALTYGTVSLVNPGADYWIIGSDGSEIEEKAKEDIVSKIMLGLMFVLSLSTVISLAWVYLLSYIAIFMVNAIIISLVVISVVGAVVVLSLGYPSFGFLLLAMGLLTLLISLYFQSRIEFASINLDIACKAVVAMPSTIGYSLLMLLFQAAYVLVWCIAAIGFATNDYKVSKFFHGEEYTLDQCSSYTYSSNFDVDGVSLTCASGTCHACLCDGTLVSNSPCFTPRFYWSSMFGLLLALIWTNSVMVNIVHCTVVAAVARWWTTGTCTVEALQYFFSTFTSTSLGSICFGSLLGAIVRTVRAVTSFLHARVRRSNDNSILGKLNRWAASVLDYLLTILDRIIVYFNRYAFCYVAIEEYDYIRASFAATTLLRARGFTALLNDDLLDFVIYISNTFIACVTMIAAYIFAKVVRLPTVYMYLLVVFGFFCGYVMGAVVLSTISSAITAVYVCFARDPAAFEATHPHLYSSMAAAWSKIFPGSQSLSSRSSHQEKSSHSENKESFAISSRKKVHFSVSSAATIHGSYGSSSGEDDGSSKVNLHQREMGANSLGIGNTSGDKSKGMGFWSASLVQMVQNNFASGGASADNASEGKIGGTYVRVPNEDTEVNKTDHPSTQQGMWGTASAMAANLITDFVTKTSFAPTGPTAAQLSSSGMSSLTGNNQGSWTTQASPSFSPFPAPTSGLHGGYGDYQHGYTEAMQNSSHRSSSRDEFSDVELQKYVGL